MADSRPQVSDSEPTPDLPVDGGYVVIAGVSHGVGGDTGRPLGPPGSPTDGRHADTGRPLGGAPPGSPTDDHHAVGAAADPAQTTTSSALGAYQRQDGCHGEGGPLDQDQFQWDVMASKLGTTRMLLELVMSAKHQHNRRHGNRQPDAFYVSPGGVLQPITVPSRTQSGPGGTATGTASHTGPGRSPPSSGRAVVPALSAGRVDSCVGGHFCGTAIVRRRKAIDHIPFIVHATAKLPAIARAADRARSG